MSDKASEAVVPTPDNVSVTSEKSGGSNLSEYDEVEIDLTEDRMYQVLSCFLESGHDGMNLCECLQQLNETLTKQAVLLAKLVEVQSAKS